MSEELKPCPWCGSVEHLIISPCGSMTADMPDRPHRVLCTHIDHDCIDGPVGYGKAAAVWHWNTRAPDPRIAELEAENKRLRELMDQAECDLKSIYSGDVGPVLLNTKVATCARKHEAGKAIRSLHRARKALKGPDHD